MPKFNNYFSHYDLNNIIAQVGILALYGLSVYVLCKFKEEINQITINLISFIGEHNKELVAFIISIIIILLFFIAFKKYRQNKKNALNEDNHSKEICNEIEKELIENINDENFEGPIIDLEAKVNDYFEKRQIELNLKKNIMLKLSDLINKEDSNLKKHYIYIDEKVNIYIKLRNSENNLNTQN